MELTHRYQKTIQKEGNEVYEEHDKNFNSSYCNVLHLHIPVVVSAIKSYFPYLIAKIEIGDNSKCDINWTLMTIDPLIEISLIERGSMFPQLVSCTISTVASLEQY